MPAMRFPHYPDIAAFFASTCGFACFFNTLSTSLLTNITTIYSVNWFHQRVYIVPAQRFAYKRTACVFFRSQSKHETCGKGYEGARRETGACPLRSHAAHGRPPRTRRCGDAASIPRSGECASVSRMKRCAIVNVARSHATARARPTTPCRTPAPRRAP